MAFSIGVLPIESLRTVMQALRRRHLVIDPYRMESVLTDSVRILDLDETVDECGLHNDSTIQVCIRVRGGSSRLNSERMYTLHS